MGRIGEDLWKKNVRKMPKYNISGQKPVPVQVELYRYRDAEGNLYRYRSKLYRYRLCSG